MSDIICVTNRGLCEGDFPGQLERIARLERPRAVILREKDLPAEDYTALAREVSRLLLPLGAPLIPHFFADAALSLHARAVHLPLAVLRELPPAQKRAFETIGTSVHSMDEALEAQNLGAGYLVAGHIFETDCKKGLAGRGLSFLREVCEAVRIPVWAIGGITPENLGSVLAAGAAGGCVMSLLMRHDYTRGGVFS